MNTANKKLYLYLGVGIAAAAVIGATVYFGSGDTLQGSLGRAGKVSEKTSKSDKKDTTNQITSTIETNATLTYTEEDNSTATVIATETSNDVTLEPIYSDNTVTLEASFQEETSTITASLVESPSLSIVRHASNTDSITLYLSSVGLNAPDQYYAICYQTENEAVFQDSRIDQPAINLGEMVSVTVKSLMPGTKYTCQAAVATPMAVAEQYQLSRNSANIYTATRL